MESTYSCDFLLSTATYSAPGTAGSNVVVSSIATGTQQTGCTWSATVTSGNAWLTCTSSGEGDGNIVASYTANPSTTDRVGTIEVTNGSVTQPITVTQSGANCNYSLSLSNYACPDHTANIYTNIASVTTPAGCAWTANVTSGSQWLSTSSTGNGNGLLSILVSANSTTSSRTGIININGATITITQPSDPTGINDLAEATFGVSPNPATNLLTVKRAKSTNNEVYNLIDITGKTVLTGLLSGTSTEIEISELNKGMYFLSIQGSYQKAVKVIKQ
jgi:hypothetical protein